MTMTLEKMLPNGFHYREAWLASLGISGTKWRTACKGGHPLTLTGGAYKATTTNGLIMRGAERVTITDPAALSINDNLTVVLPTFKLTTLFSEAAGADMGIMNLNNGSVIAHLESDTGAMVFVFDNADGGADLTVSTTKVSWAADTEWQVSFTFDKDAGASSVEIFVNGVSDSTHAEADTVLTIPAGNTTYGYDGTTYLTGKITRGPMVWSTTLLTGAQLLRVYKGIPYATNLVLQHQLDEGRGLTIDDKATGAACDGVISGTNTANIWDYGVEQACMGLDGRTGYAVSAASAMDVTFPWSLVWVGKLKSTYINTLTSAVLFKFYVDANNYVDLKWYLAVDPALLNFQVKGSGGAVAQAWATGYVPAIGNYAIIIAVADSTHHSRIYGDGVAFTLSANATDPFVGLATAYLGRYHTALQYEVSSPIFVGLIDGALNGRQALQFSRDLNNWLGLGLGI